ncbi:Lipid A export ATP-binding/permease protein MsbA [compost metagenome]
MSGGQKQRVALARAILKDVPILLLDEATSALDAMSESLIQKSIGILSRNKTIVIVAHRLSTVEHADQIIVLDQGKIVERGTHSELLIRKGLYASLYEQDHRPGSKDQNGGAYAAAEME